MKRDTDQQGDERAQDERARAEVNPAARSDRPGEPHDDLARSDRDPAREEVKGYQDADLDPRDAGGIGG